MSVSSIIQETYRDELLKLKSEITEKNFEIEYANKQLEEFKRLAENWRAIAESERAMTATRLESAAMLISSLKNEIKEFLLNWPSAGFPFDANTAMNRFERTEKALMGGK